jgi:23S rRNA pseudouridine2605 synthase
MRERLQKFLAGAGAASRREAEKMIAAGRVKVNGQSVTQQGSTIDPAADAVFLDGRRLNPQKKLYYLFYKPRGVVTTLSDPEGRKNVGSYARDLPGRVFPVGRLDYHTEGLLLLTNDGELAQRLTHPKYAIEKTYRVGALGFIGEETLDRLRLGVQLDDGPAAPADVALLEYRPEYNITVFDITIREGRNRQVRRMCDAVGHPVRTLCRRRFAGLEAGSLRRGRLRELTPGEVAGLFRLTDRYV